MTMFFKGTDVRVARILTEDEDFITIEVMKNMDDSWSIQEGDKFLTVLFITNEGMRGNNVKAWLPWKDS